MQHWRLYISLNHYLWKIKNRIVGQKYALGIYNFNMRSMKQTKKHKHEHESVIIATNLRDGEHISL
jgi:hypothetical protein